MLSPLLHRLLAQARADDLRRAGTLERRAARARTVAPQARADVAVTLRLAFPDDAAPLARLAALDSAPVLNAPVLLAEVSGQLRAAVSIHDGAVVADPFHPTEALVELLRARTRQLQSQAAPSRDGRRAWARLGLPAWR